MLIVESGRLTECVEYCIQNNIGWLHISPYHGYDLNNVHFLFACKHIVGIHMQQAIADFSGLYALPKLTYLSAVFPHDIDVSRLPLLSDLSTDWSKTIDVSIFASASLKRLWLRGYRPSSRSLERVISLNALNDLHLVSSSITSIRGVETLQRLKRLGLSYCRRLEDIGPLNGLECSLEELELDHCKAIKDTNPIFQLRKLRKLIMFSCHDLASLQFIKKLSKLEFISFVNTKVIDGDMTPCFGLNYAGFLKNRHYSHTPEEVVEIIKSRHAIE